GLSANGGLQFTSTGYTLTGAGLVLGGTSNGVEVGSGLSATVATVLSGSGGLVKTGAGALSLGSANTLTGTASITQGVLRVTNGGALQSMPIVVQTGGTLALPTATRLVLSATSLTVDQATGGTVDIGKGRIDIGSGATEADLRADLIAGRTAAGTFSGTSGIMTTGGKASVNSANAVVGYRVTAGSAVVAWAAYGDSNLDGVVNSTDISLVNGGGRYNAGAPATWQQGDYNYSGDVNSTDISLLNGTGLYGTASYLPVTVASLSTTTTGTLSVSRNAWLAYAIDSETRNTRKR
ncbi:MAG: dockerin type I domain-containing protein, partial [Planctomycetaceae bacterium]